MQLRVFSEITNLQAAEERGVYRKLSNYQFLKNDSAPCI